MHCTHTFKHALCICALVTVVHAERCHKCSMYMSVTVVSSTVAYCFWETDCYCCCLMCSITALQCCCFCIATLHVVSTSNSMLVRALLLSRLLLLPPATSMYVIVSNAAAVTRDIRMSSQQFCKAHAGTITGTVHVNAAQLLSLASRDCHEHDDSYGKAHAASTWCLPEIYSTDAAAVRTCRCDAGSS